MLDFVLGAAAGGVHQDQVEVAHRPHGLAHFPRRGDDLHRQVDDVGIGPQLLDGGDAVGVDGDQAHAAFFLEPEVGRQLGDGGGFAHAGRPDQGRQPAPAGRDRDRAGDADVGLDHPRDAGLQQQRVGQLAAGDLARGPARPVRGRVPRSGRRRSGR